MMKSLSLMRTILRLTVVLSLASVTSCTDNIFAQDMEQDTLKFLNPDSKYIAVFGDMQCYFTESQVYILRYA